MIELVLPQSFPVNEYTPHGYLDNPYHSMVLNRSGVIRSLPPLGFGFWCAKFKGAYGNGVEAQTNYLSLLHLAFHVDGQTFATADDFRDHNARLYSRYHTKHMLSYDWMCHGLLFSCRYFLPRENTLACRIEVQNSDARPQQFTLHATHIFGHWTHGWWGSNGLAGRYLEDVDALVSTIWAYGPYFALGSDGVSVAHKSTGDEAQWRDWLRANNVDDTPPATVNGSGPLYNVMSFRCDLSPGTSDALTLGLARGPNEPWALEELRTGLRQALPTLEQQLDEDEAFWSQCPQLEGDWPEVWRRGWVYDFETLRMNVRRPLGIFRHRWDAMQVHSPRSVLAEAAVDMLALVYADPDAAKEVLFGTFADAPQPNVPCTREDGSMNMIAADGEACGTAPSWCFPIKVVQVVHVLTGDDAWLQALYPLVKDYLEWWLANRTGPDGSFHCKCDWESGQDGSKRFPVGEGGVAENVRTVDVEAGMAEAFRLMARFAQIVDAVEDAPYWQKLAEKRAAAVQSMFHDGAFRDIDTNTGQPIVLDDHDVMMLAPLTCQVATPAQVEAVRPLFAHFRAHPQHALEWPSFFWMFTEAAWAAGEQLQNAENIADIADRIYNRTDSGQLHFVEPDQPFAWRVPGVANEYWPLADDQLPGGEAYGWGATLPAQFLRGLVGFREVDDRAAPHDPDRVAFLLAPALPARLADSGKRLRVTNLRVSGLDFDLTYEVRPEGRLGVRLDLNGSAAFEVTVTDDAGEELGSLKLEHGTGAFEFDAQNGRRYRVDCTLAYAG
jgi:hypothetical protein